MSNRRIRRRVRTALLPAAVVLAAAALTACGGTGSTSTPVADPTSTSVADPTSTSVADPASTPVTDPASTPAADPTSTPGATGEANENDGRSVYVAVGASETVGVGADDPARQAWPLVLRDRALPRSTYLNVGVSGSTVGDALAAQLPKALAADPAVATVWLAVNDITHLVPVEAYEQQLRTLVHGLRRNGLTTVLVGNVPAVQDLPAFRACLPGAGAGDLACALPVVPPEDMVTAAVTEFNAAIERVARAEGAQVVDLSARRDLTRLTADDGFHPSTEGHRRIAATFARALDKGEQ